ncbi:hypothetical protein KCV06_g184, partial [Aureobasidium melanogenum]
MTYVFTCQHLPPPPPTPVLSPCYLDWFCVVLITFTVSWLHGRCYAVLQALSDIPIHNSSTIPFNTTHQNNEHVDLTRDQSTAAKLLILSTLQRDTVAHGPALLIFISRK